MPFINLNFAYPKLRLKIVFQTFIAHTSSLVISRNQEKAFKLSIHAPPVLFANSAYGVASLIFA
jgi:hypothetical protein